MDNVKCTNTTIWPKAESKFNSLFRISIAPFHPQKNTQNYSELRSNTLLAVVQNSSTLQVQQKKTPGKLRDFKHTASGSSSDFFIHIAGPQKDTQNPELPNIMWLLPVVQTSSSPSWPRGRNWARTLPDHITFNYNNQFKDYQNFVPAAGLHERSSFAHYQLLQQA